MQQDIPRPRIQIIRGLPGSGKTTLARQYPCFHIELDHYCYRSGAYRRGAERDNLAKSWELKIVKNVTSHHMDFVVTGVLPKLDEEFGYIIWYGMREGYEIWVQDCMELKGSGNVHGVRMEDFVRMKSDFEPYNTESMARVGRSSSPREREIKLSVGIAIAYYQYCKQWVHNGMMPNDYPNVPELDGL